MFWPLIVANSWESCLTFAAMSDDYGAPGSPKWSRKELVLLKPADFSAEFRQKLDRFMADTKVKLDEKQQKEVDELMGRLDDKLYQRLGGSLDVNRRRCAMVVGYCHSTAILFHFDHGHQR